MKLKHNDIVKDNGIEEVGRIRLKYKVDFFRLRTRAVKRFEKLH